MDESNQPIDILILTNAPGEVTTWVRPVVRAIRNLMGEDRSAVRISVVLSPCPNATGKEISILNSYPQIDRAQAANSFNDFLLWGKTAESWDWRAKGVVLYLGGDQFFTAIVGKRLGYRTLVYAEWEARWLNLIDRFVLMNQSTLDALAPQHQTKCLVVGDLMVESQAEISGTAPTTEVTIGILPGSKAMKLAVGLPFTLAVAELLHDRYPQIQFGLPVAPTLDLETLASYGDRHTNPTIDLVGGTTATLVSSPQPALITGTGVEILLHTEFPAYEWLSRCTLCLTTIGANTAELGALAVPAIVLIPIQKLDAMRAWDGILGLLVNLPVLGTPIAKLINWWAFKTLNGRKLAWPNIWAGGREIMPELVGELQPQAVADLVAQYLDAPELLQQMRQELRSIRGSTGAADKIAKEIEYLVIDPTQKNWNLAKSSIATANTIDTQSEKYF
jgi:hypothetical protein